MNLNRKSFFRCLFLGIIFLALVLRLFLAWSLRHSPNSDFGIVALMAKHMAEGRTFPVFFYGQAYMGSLEPMVSAVFCKLFGVHGFSVCLGPALIGVLLLPLIYLLVREMASPRAGLIAMLFAVVGADVHFHYMVAPRGGYPLALLLGLLVLWLAVRISKRVLAKEHASLSLYALLGLLAGLGWWTNQLIAPYLFCALLILIYGLRRRCIHPGTLLAGAFFVIGCSPWWLWNLSNDWASLQFGGSLGKTPFWEGMGSYFYQISKMAELKNGWNWLDWLRLASFLMLSVGFLATLKGHFKRNPRPAVMYGLATLGVFLALGLLYSTSHYATFNASRYVLPLFPILALIVGIGTDWLLLRTRSGFGLIPLILVLAPSFYLAAGVNKYTERNNRQWAKAEKIVEFAQRQGIEALGCEYGEHWMNFAAREQIAFADVRYERYAPYAKKQVMAEQQAFINNPRGVAGFLEATRASSSVTNIAGYQVHYDIKRRTSTWKYVASENVSLIAPGLENANVLFDWNLDTSLRGISEGKTGAELLFEFENPVHLSGIRLLSRDNQYPWHCQVDVKTNRDKEWHVGMPKRHATEYFWSGERILHDGLLFQNDWKLDAPGTKSVRIRFPAQNRPYVYAISEILFMEDVEASGETAGSDVDTVLEALKKHGMDRLFAPRYVMNHAHERAHDGLSVEVSHPLIRTVREEPASKDARFIPLILSAKTAVLCYSADVPRTSEVLAVRGFEMETSRFGELTLLTPLPGGALPPDPDLQALYWTESGAFYGDEARYAKKRAHRMYTLLEEGPDENSLLAILDIYPEYRPAQQDLLELYTSRSFHAKADALRSGMKLRQLPPVAASMRFPGGIRFLGYDLESDSCRKGDRFGLSFYWKCPENVHPGDLAVFVHFIGPDEQIFQDDHVFLKYRTDDLQFQPYPEVFIESRCVEVPESLPPGQYTCRMGLYERLSGKRLKPRGALPVKSRAMELPFVISVTE